MLHKIVLYPMHDRIVNIFYSLYHLARCFQPRIICKFCVVLLSVTLILTAFLFACLTDCFHIFIIILSHFVIYYIFNFSVRHAYLFVAL
jgi:hypothetical protein